MACGRKNPPMVYKILYDLDLIAVEFLNHFHFHVFHFVIEIVFDRRMELLREAC